MKVVISFLALLLLGIAVGAGVGRFTWDRSVAALEARIGSDAKGSRRLASADLPSAVRRYLARAIPEHAEQIVAARLTQEGTFQMGEGPAGWRPFTAVEAFRASEPAFYWDARIAMVPGVPVKVLDSYIDGEARMLGKILGLVPVVDAAAEPGLKSGALARYLAEAVWIPTRLVSGPDLTWRHLDDRAAEATLRDRGTTVSLTFTFSEEGDPREVRGVRPREVDGDYIDTPWLGRFADHRDIDGFRIPTYGEVAWIVDGVEVLYWRGTITSAEFATAQAPWTDGHLGRARRQP
jgi:hypothetical protein